MTIHICLSIIADAQNIKSDTLLAAKEYRRAKYLLEIRQFNKFDSILIYSQSSARLYLKYKNINGLLGSLCNQIQVYSRNAMEKETTFLYDSIAHLSIPRYGEQNLFIVDAYHPMGFLKNSTGEIPEALQFLTLNTSDSGSEGHPFWLTPSFDR